MIWNKKKKKTYLNIWYEWGGKREIYGLGEIPIKEDVIISKSITFFNDPEPCYIHRGAVVIRLNEEVLKELSLMGESNQVEAKLINKEILDYISLPNITHFKIENQ